MSIHMCLATLASLPFKDMQSLRRRKKENILPYGFFPYVTGGRDSDKKVRGSGVSGHPTDSDVFVLLASFEGR